MAYNKHNFKSGATLYAVQLNEMDAQIAANEQTAAAALPRTGGTMTGAITLPADPTEPMQAATKQYVDSKLEENVELLGKEVKWADVTEKPFDKNNVLNPESLPDTVATKEYVETAAAPEVFVATYEATPFEDIKAAHDAGKVCFCKSAQGKSIFPLLTISSLSANFVGSYAYGIRTYTAKSLDGETIWTDTQSKQVKTTGDEMTGYLTLHADPTEAMQATTKQYVDSKVPAVTTSDNGKFLRVVNGAWAAVALENAEGGSF